MERRPDFMLVALNMIRFDWKHWARPGLIAVLALMAVAMPPLVGRAQDADGPQVTEIRVGQDGTRTRLVFELNEKVSHRWFTLPQPTRLVVDFQDDVGFAKDPASVQLPDGSLVKALRAGRFRPGTVRMVMDLTKAAKISVFAIPADGKQRHRLVIDVMAPKKGEKATDVPPPEDVVTSDAAPVVRKTVRSSGRFDESERAPVVPRQVVSSKDDGQIIVVVDPGHGGVDPGALGRTYKTREKDLTLAMAKRVRDKLASRKIKVILTRDTDIFIPLPDRVKIAQRANADLFVSLHADSAPDRSVTGATVYMVSDKASDREARRLADSENSRDVLAGIALENETKEVQSILISLVQRDTMNNSAYMGQSILREVGDMTAVRKRQLMYAGFRVLKAPDVPSVLVEMGYLSNPKEEAALRSSSHQSRLAAAIADGIRDYVIAHVHH